MKRVLFLACCVVSAAAFAAAPQGHAPASRGLTADQIIAKNAEARGGLKAWRAVDTLTMSGKVEAGSEKNPELPFVMKMKRAHMSRLEIRFEDQTALQVYDGKQGWKVRPFLGRDEVEPFTRAEAKEATDWQELDGPLIDYAKKGTKVQLQGRETVEGHPAYKLQLTLKDGSQRRVWIDAASFLELKMDGEPRVMDGKLRDVSVFYREYRKEGALTVPHVFETFIDGGKLSHKMSIEQVMINQPMDNAIFAKPQAGLVRSAFR